MPSVIDLSEPEGNKLALEKSSRNLRRKRSKPEFFTGNKYYGHIRDWSNREKLQLLQALKKYGVLNIKEVSKAVPTKSRESVQMFINGWIKAGRNSSSGYKINLIAKEALWPNSLTGNNLNVKEKCPIDQWLEKLEKSQTTSMHSVIKCASMAKAFLYISKYERHPGQVECAGINFRSLYEFLFCMLNGYPPPRLSKHTARYLLKTVYEVADHIKGMNMAQELELLSKVHKVSFARKGNLRQYQGNRYTPTSTDVPDKVGASMRRLLDAQGFNPLNVPIDLLHYSKS